MKELGMLFAASALLSFAACGPNVQNGTASPNGDHERAANVIEPPTGTPDNTPTTSETATGAPTAP